MGGVSSVRTMKRNRTFGRRHLSHLCVRSFGRAETLAKDSHQSH